MLRILLSILIPFSALLLISALMYDPEQSSSDASQSVSRSIDPVSSAYKACDAFMETGLATECEVDGWDSAVEVTIDTNSAQARIICKSSVELIQKNAEPLNDRWSLRIFSPYSGERPIASCKF